MTVRFSLTTRSPLTTTVLFKRSLSIDAHVASMARSGEHDGVTTMVDNLTFTAPLGPLGRLAEWLVLDNYLRRLIQARNEYLTQL